MGSQVLVADSWSCPNYLGELFLVGGNKTPFLNMIGGLNQGGARIKVTKSFDFPMAQPWSLDASAQPAITETGSLTAPDPKTYGRAEEINTVQIFQRSVTVSYVKMSQPALVSGLNIQDPLNPVTDEIDFQIAAHMKQIAFDVDHSMLNGVYQKATAANVAAKMRGIITGTVTNEVPVTAAAISKTTINELLREMAASGAPFENPVIFVNAFQKQALTALYGSQPSDRQIGGLAVDTIYTDFAIMGIVWSPNVPADTLLIAEMSAIMPVVCEVPKKGVMFYEELARTGASEKGQIYGQIGIDYGPEKYHGKITGLSTS